MIYFFSGVIVSKAILPADSDEFLGILTGLFQSGCNKPHITVIRPYLSTICTILNCSMGENRFFSTILEKVTELT